MGKLNKQHVEHLEKSLQNIDFGSVLITIHNGKITQIDTTEKKRFTETVQGA